MIPLKFTDVVSVACAQKQCVAKHKYNHFRYGNIKADVYSVHRVAAMLIIRATRADTVDKDQSMFF